MKIHFFVYPNYGNYDITYQQCWMNLIDVKHSNNLRALDSNHIFVLW